MYRGFKTGIGGLCAAVLLGACTTTTVAAPPLELDPSLAGRVHVGTIDYDLNAPLNDVSDHFRDTFRHDFEWTLKDCARGPRLLELRVRLDSVRRVQPITAARSGGVHHLSGVVEFVEPGTTRVVGRYPIEAAVDAGRGLGALLTDQEAEISEAFARELCRKARLTP